ncbi:pesticin C-terminus-like muramidase [Halospina sp. K52047b]|uniref:pesticin C-terminus-like muramidase n=1 Tax=Halospina sp. K52047b TaxID=2614160 RepID=UPI00124A721B|nr:pesticin C-terminus-like muramidase [Halospina sp. K52047b]KAA8982885.1 peptidase [Halospina sp. K52047b]
MPNRINYEFLSRLEGGSRTKGYVPLPESSRSGVTIATGFDLGQRDEDDLKQLELDASLITKLKPYLGVKAEAAATLIQNNPLNVTESEAKSIDQAVKAAHIGKLRTRYRSATANKAGKLFFEIPAEAQTVIASVSFQYGVNLKVVTPKFWKAASSQDWRQSVAILRNFGDAYPTRRRKEARLLERVFE